MYNLIYKKKELSKSFFFFFKFPVSIYVCVFHGDFTSPQLNQHPLHFIIFQKIIFPFYFKVLKIFLILFCAFLSLSPSKSEQCDRGWGWGRVKLFTSIEGESSCKEAWCESLCTTDNWALLLLELKLSLMALVYFSTQKLCCLNVSNKGTVLTTMACL